MLLVFSEYCSSIVKVSVLLPILGLGSSLLPVTPNSGDCSDGEEMHALAQNLPGSLQLLWCWDPAQISLSLDEVHTLCCVMKVASQCMAMQQDLQVASGLPPIRQHCLPLRNSRMLGEGPSHVLPGRATALVLPVRWHHKGLLHSCLELP